MVRALDAPAGVGAPHAPVSTGAGLLDLPSASSARRGCYQAAARRRSEQQTRSDHDRCD
jgi:hypothetical protein